MDGSPRCRTARGVEVTRNVTTHPTSGPVCHPASGLSSTGGGSVFERLLDKGDVSVVCEAKPGRVLEGQPAHIVMLIGTTILDRPAVFDDPDREPNGRVLGLENSVSRMERWVDSDPELLVQLSGKRLLRCLVLLDVSPGKVPDVRDPLPAWMSVAHQQTVVLAQNPNHAVVIHATILTSTPRVRAAPVSSSKGFLHGAGRSSLKPERPRSVRDGQARIHCKERTIMATGHHGRLELHRTGR